MGDRICCQILAGEQPGSFVYRDDSVAAFMDTQPVNPGHLLVVPVRHAAFLADLDGARAASLMRVGQRLENRPGRADLDRIATELTVSYRLGGF